MLNLAIKRSFEYETNDTKSLKTLNGRIKRIDAHISKLYALESLSDMNKRFVDACAEQCKQYLKEDTITVSGEDVHMENETVKPKLAQITNEPIDNASEQYYRALEAMRAIRKTGMSYDTFNEYVAYGEIQLSVLPMAILEWKKMFGRKDAIPPVIPCLQDLPDMYLRWGRWEEAERCIAEGVRLGVTSFEEQSFWKDAIPKRKEAVSGLVSLLRQSAEPVKQNALKKLCGDLDPESVTWALRYFKGIRREKVGSSYAVSLSGEQGVAL